MHIIGWIVFGLIVGAVAKLLGGTRVGGLSPSCWVSPGRWSGAFWDML